MKHADDDGPFDVAELPDEAIANADEFKAAESPCNDEDVEISQPKSSRTVKRRISSEDWHSGFILFCSFTVFTIKLGMVLSFGVYVVDIRDFYACSRQDAATVAAVLNSCSMLTAPLCAVVYKRYGCRTCIISGALLACFGFCFSYFADTVMLLTLFQAIVGIGFGMTETASVAILCEYFTRYLFFASSFICISVSVGTFIFPPFFIFIVEKYGLQGSMLINAAVVIQVLIPLGWLMRNHPKKWCPKPTTLELSRKVSLTVSESVKHLLSVELCSSVGFVVLCVQTLFSGGFVNAFYSMIVEHMSEQGISQVDASHILMVAAVATLFTRILSVYLSHASCTNLPLLYASSALLCTAGLFLATFCSSFTCFLLSVSWIIAAIGLMIPIMAPLIISLFGAEKCAPVYGYTGFTAGIGTFFAPLLAGLIGDEQNSTQASFYFISGCAVIACALSLVLFAWSAWSRRSEVRL